MAGSPERLEPVSPTFHGRDIFAPVAGRARRRHGALVRSASRSTPDSLRRLNIPVAVIDGRRPGAPRAPLRHVREPDPRRADRAGRRAGAAARRRRVGAHGRAPAPRDRSRARSRTSTRAGCCSTKTGWACSRWRSTAARPPSCSAPAATTRCWSAPGEPARLSAPGRRARLAPAAPAAAPTRPTSARGSWRPPGRRTDRS